MDLRGRIELFGVAQIIQILGQAEVTGKLVLSGSGQRARCYFHEGRLIYARSDARRERVGEYLVRRELIDAAQLEGARMRAELEPQRRIGSILVESGSITAEQLQLAITEQIKESVYHCVRIEAGSFSFYSQIYPENEDILLDVSLEMLVLEGLRQLDELQREDGD